MRRLLALAVAALLSHAARAEEPVPVAVAPAAEATLTETVEATGTLQASQTADLFPKVASRTVLEVAAREGDPVRAGQVLARLDDALVKAQLQGLDARVGALTARGAAADARLGLLEADAERARSLFHQGVSPRQLLDRAEAEVQVARAEREALGAELRALEESKSELLLLLSYHQVEAPWAGVVLERLADPGDVTSTSRPLLVLGRVDRLKLRLRVPEADVPRLRPGQRVRMGVDAVPDRSFEGRVARVLPSLDPATRTGEAEVQLEAGGTPLRAGMFVRARVETGTRKAVLIPRDAARKVPGSGVWFVYVITPGGTAERRDVTLGAAAGDRVEAVTGVAAGERVVVRGEGLLKSGAAVRIADTAGSR